MQRTAGAHLSVNTSPESRMKLIATTFLAVTLIAHSAFAAEPITPSPLLGACAVDVSRLPMAPASTRIYSVSPDGNSMTETVAYFGSDGQPILRKNHFARIC